MFGELANSKKWGFAGPFIMLLPYVKIGLGILGFHDSGLRIFLDFDKEKLNAPRIGYIRGVTNHREGISKSS